MGDELQNIGSRPAGLKGSLSGRIMNAIHKGLYSRIIKSVILDKITPPTGSMLDIGCGGGLGIKLFSKVLPSSMICGIDYSKEMVDLSRKVNRAGIKKGVVDVRIGNITAIPFPDNHFDLVTAFDTVNFWHDYEKAFAEILRVLTTDRLFFIVNGYPGEGTKWYNFVKFKNAAEYKNTLTKYGFRDIDAVIEKNTIIVWGKK